jgi:hypothetical protein
MHNEEDIFPFDDMENIEGKNPNLFEDEDADIFEEDSEEENREDDLGLDFNH